MTSIATATRKAQRLCAGGAVAGLVSFLALPWADVGVYTRTGGQLAAEGGSYQFLWLVPVGHFAVLVATFGRSAVLGALGYFVATHLLVVAYRYLWDPQLQRMIGPGPWIAAAAIAAQAMCLLYAVSTGDEALTEEDEVAAAAGVGVPKRYQPTPPVVVVAAIVLGASAWLLTDQVEAYKPRPGRPASLQDYWQP